MLEKRMAPSVIVLKTSTRFRYYYVVKTANMTHTNTHTEIEREREKKKHVGYQNNRQHCYENYSTNKGRSDYSKIRKMQ